MRSSVQNRLPAPYCSRPTGRKVLRDGVLHTRVGTETRAVAEKRKNAWTSERDEVSGGERRRRRAGRLCAEDAPYWNFDISKDKVVMNAQAGQDKRCIDEMAGCIEAGKTDISVNSMQRSSVADTASDTVVSWGKNGKFVVVRKLYGRKQRHVHQQQQ